MSPEFSLGWEVFEIIWINLLLSGDNAILIALACRQLPVRQRRWGVFLGALGGVVLRIAFTLVVVELMAVPYLKIVGSLLLLIIAVKLLIDETEHSDVTAKPNLWSAVGAIIMADAVMSLDNVIAIAAAARGSTNLIVFGLLISVPIVMFGAGALLKVLERFPALVWAGAALLGWVAGDMAAADPALPKFVHVANHGALELGLSIGGCVLVLGVAFAIAVYRQWREDQRVSRD
ncbi:TerC family protein [Methylocystis sp. L43]|jgi:YjbE family integral membrane protein|uniref:TerC family protein n=1 Tax=unclassified Methylocystis TaxID=2625913 RepID=UPI0018C1F57A|nr:MULTISPECIES: TerC family protein [unclassified Methylocystis]MBG0796739.1 TerC family protein [Methylocystis sp. L43]MBG0806738.1 TerC family protein [Methylocystis sp. H15]